MSPVLGAYCVVLFGRFLYLSAQLCACGRAAYVWMAALKASVRKSNALRNVRRIKLHQKTKGNSIDIEKEVQRIADLVVQQQIEYENNTHTDNTDDNTDNTDGTDGESTLYTNSDHDHAEEKEVVADSGDIELISSNQQALTITPEHKTEHRMEHKNDDADHVLLHAKDRSNQWRGLNSDLDAHLLLSTFGEESTVISRFGPLTNITHLDLKYQVSDEEIQSRRSAVLSFDRILSAITASISDYRLKNPSPTFIQYLCDHWTELSTLIAANSSLRNQDRMNEVLCVGKGERGRRGVGSGWTEEVAVCYGTVLKSFYCLKVDPKEQWVVE